VPVVPLASEKDVEASIGRALTIDEHDRVGAILDKASELFRRRSGQQFTPGSSEVRVRVIADKVTLTQRPVVDVISVTGDTNGASAIGFERFKSQLTLESVPSGRMVRVKYTHGGEVPELVRLCIADVARKVLQIPGRAAAGVTQRSEGTGPFNESETYATWAVGGQTMLAPDDLAIADGYRVKTYGAIIMSTQ
jgi:hypothetical protein